MGLGSENSTFIFFDYILDRGTILESEQYTNGIFKIVIRKNVFYIL